MSLTSLVFFAFLGVSLILYYIIPKKAQWVILLAVSLFFFAYSSKLLILYMIATTLLIYVGALFIQKYNDEFKAKKKTLSKEDRKQLKSAINKKTNTILTVIVIACVGILAVLKYCNFFGGIINDVSEIIADKSIVPTFNLLLPLGISYYTLMSVSYIVDVYRGTIEAEKNPCRLLLFVCYFPHITEGPFDTYENLNLQFRAYHKFNYDKFINALCLLLFGLVKKMVLADRLAYISNEIFDNYTSYSGLQVFVGMLSYTICIYADFSGCIDIVRGVSKMFGIDIAENFNRPFFSHSVQEFWRRWHITLGGWLKNYIFYPVSLSKVEKNFSKKINKVCKNRYYAATIPTFLPLLCVWIVMGIWHGASWKYVVYGLYYFAIIFMGVMCEPIFLRVFKNLKIQRNGKAFGAFQIIRTDLLVAVGLTMFRADTLTQFGSMIKSLGTINFNVFTILNQFPDLHKLDYVLMVFLIIALFIKELKEEKGKNINILIETNVFRRWLWITIAILMVILLGIYGTGYTEQVSVYAEF